MPNSKHVDLEDEKNVFHERDFSLHLHIYLTLEQVKFCVPPSMATFIITCTVVLYVISKQVEIQVTAFVPNLT